MDPQQKASRLRHALRGLDLSEREERIVGWAGQIWDDETMEIVCSLMERVREAGFLDGIQHYSPADERDRHDDSPDDTDPTVDLSGRIIEGNSGPGW